MVVDVGQDILLGPSCQYDVIAVNIQDSDTH